MKRFLLLAITVGLLCPLAANADRKQILIDRSRAIGIGSMASCLLGIDRITSEQAQYLVVTQLDKDGLEYLKPWLKGPDATKAIMRMKELWGPSCDQRPDSEKARIIVSELSKTWSFE